MFTWGGYLEAVGLLFLLLAVMWLVLWCIRRFGKFNFLPRPGSLPRDALIMETQMPLGPRKGLMVVRFLDKRLLLGVTDSQISMLAESPCSPDTPTEKTLTENMKADNVARKHANFQEMVDQARQDVVASADTVSGSSPSV